MNTATAAAVGTSLEVLAPYLPYGIEVQYLLDEKLYKLDGLVNGRAVFEYFQDGEGWVNLHQTPDYLLPVLRDFSQLTVPLPDGTPLVDKLAEILFGDTLEPNCELGAGFDWFGNYVATANGVLLFSISLYWHIKCANDLPAGFEAYDYLRSQHFGVGLQSSQYIAKAALATDEKQQKGGVSEA